MSKPSIRSKLCFAVMLLLNLQAVFSIYIQTKYENKSLERPSPDFYYQSAWSASQSVTVIEISCNSSSYYLGASLNPASVFTGIYKDLPPHQMVYYAFDYSVFVRDTGRIWLQPIELRVCNESQPLMIVIPKGSQNESCLTGPTMYYNFKMRIYGRIRHNASDLNFTIHTKSNSTGSYRIGFANIILYYGKEERLSLSEGTCAFGGFIDSTQQCYQPFACDTSCYKCYGPSSTECYECASGYSFNGTSCVQCDSSCAGCSGPAKNQCTSCKEGYYMFNNSTCLQDCQSPLVNSSDGTVNFCEIPSIELPYPTPTYFYWNNTFQPTCLYPLASEDIGGSGVGFCRFPCDTNNYLYWNNTCLNKCDYSLYDPKQEGEKKFCSPKCPKNQGLYFFHNESCLGSCEPPMRIKNDHLFVSLCLPPCDNPLMYFYENSKECRYECLELVTVSSKGHLVCQPLPPSTIHSSIMFDSIFLAPFESETVTLLTLVKLMQYVRYLDIKMPPRLERLATSRARNVLSLKAGPGVTSTIYTWFNKQTSTYMIERQRLHSRFLANFGGEIFVLMIVFLSALCIIVLNAIARHFEWTNFGLVTTKFQTLAKWNVFFMLFGTYLDDIILFSAVEFATVEFESTSTYLSFFGCLVIIVLTLLFLTCIIMVTRTIMNIRPSKTTASNSPDKSPGRFTSCQVFFLGYNLRNGINNFFYLIYVLRTALPLFLSVTLFAVPITQAALQLVISIIIVSYVLFARPLKKKINQYQLAITEIVVFGLNICVLTLAIFDYQGNQNTLGYELLGDIIIVGNLALNLFVIVILAIKFVLLAKEIKSLHKKNSTQAWISCIHFLVLPLQQSAFGFEELLGDITLTETKQTVGLRSVSPLESNKSRNTGGFGSNTKTNFGEVVTVKNIGQTGTSQGINLDEETSFTERLERSSSRLMLANSQIMIENNDAFRKKEKISRRYFEYESSQYNPNSMSEKEKSLTAYSITKTNTKQRQSSRNYKDQK